MTEYAFGDTVDVLSHAWDNEHTGPATVVQQEGEELLLRVGALAVRALQGRIHYIYPSIFGSTFWVPTSRVSKVASSYPHGWPISW